MQRWPINILILLVLFSFRANTMEEEEGPITGIPDELLIPCLMGGDPDVKNITFFSQVCWKWACMFSNEGFWEKAYIKKRGCAVKLKDTISYKENYKCVLFVCICTNTCGLDNYSCEYKNNRMICQQMFSNDSMVSSELEALYLNALEKKPQVFCSSFGPLTYDSSQLSPSILKALKKAVDDDVLVVLPMGNSGIGNSGKSISSTIEGNDVHETFPNVVWTAACDSESHLPLYSNFGELADIAVPNSNGTPGSAMVLAQFVTYLLTLNPLSAKIVRQILISTATKHDNVTRLSLNCEAAIKAVKEYVYPQ